MKQSKLNKLCDAFYDEFKNNGFLLAEYVDRRADDGYFDIEFICYGIYFSKTPQAVETAKKVLKKFNLRGIYIDVSPRIYQDYCFFYITNHNYKDHHDSYEIREVL